MVISGSNTHVVAENSGLELIFQNTLTVSQGATLTIAGPDLVTEQAVTVTGSAVLAVTGAWSLSVPLTLTSGGQLQVNGDLTASVAPTVSGGTLAVNGTLTASVPLTVSGSGGTLAGETIVAPALSVVNGGVLTSFAATTTQVYQLDVNVSGTVTVDATSTINVSGQGYLPGYTTGNTTVGGATGLSGGSYGGWGGSNNGSTNAVYGDYAKPDEWGSGGTAEPGGGLVRLDGGARWS